MKNRGYGVVLTGIFMFIFLLFFAEEFKTGFITGLHNCSQTVIPSLFPFLIASSLVGSGNLPRFLVKPVSFFTKLLFKLPAESIFAIVLGQFGGYLSGAKAASALCGSGKISDTQAEKLMLFSINPGIGFAVNAVGSVMLSSRNSGRIIFISICISSVLCGIICRFLPCRSDQKNKRDIKTVPFSAAVVKSVSSGTFSVFTACAFVCLFSGLTAIIGSYITNQSIKTLAVCIIEITNGCFLASEEMSLPFLSAMCAFGGICVHMQIFASAENFRINLPLFYAFRILHAVLAFAACSFILYLFPCEMQVMVNVTPKAALWSFSAPASVSLLFLSALLILDLDKLILDLDNMYKI